MAAEQLGTIGSGNHYVDIFEDEQQRIWIGVHLVPVGLGHRLASHFIQAGGGKDGMFVDPVLLDVNDQFGQEYIACMKLAGRYAYAGRDWVANRVAKLLGTQILEEVHNHHNFAWEERHNGQKLWVVHGATPAPSGAGGLSADIGGHFGDFGRGGGSREQAGPLFHGPRGRAGDVRPPGPRASSAIKTGAGCRWQKGRSAAR